jgi:phage N-6-adenine-methyltransferase
MTQAYMPKSESTEWGTPIGVFKPIDAEFGFTRDVCAVEWNAKVPERYFTPEQDGLVQPWRGETAWCNPPYGAKNIEQWLAKAHAERQHDTTTVLLVPNTTDCRWFHDYVWDIAKNKPREGVELRFIAGRIKFDVPPSMRATTEGNGNVKGSILVIVRPTRLFISACPTCGHCNQG